MWSPNASIGASGFVGSALREEALQRGHTVTALGGHPERLQQTANLTAEQSDVMDDEALARQLAGKDAVLSAFSGHASDDIYGYYMRGIRSILAAVKTAGAPRLLVVGGAGSLQTPSGQLLIDTPEFPEQIKPTAQGAGDALELLRQETELDWTMLSPAADLLAGERTGQFRLGGDRLLSDEQGQSRVSVQDYAVAMIDELEAPKHGRQRFNVAY